MRRTKWNALAFLFSGALVLAACGGQPGESAEESEPTGSQPAGSGDAEPSGEGTGTITYAIDGGLTTLSNANNDVPTAEAVSFLGAALYTYDETLTPVPALAEDLCEVSDDEVVWTGVSTYLRRGGGSGSSSESDGSDGGVPEAPSAGSPQAGLGPPPDERPDRAPLRAPRSLRGDERTRLNHDGGVTHDWVFLCNPVPMGSANKGAYAQPRLTSAARRA